MATKDDPFYDDDPTFDDSAEHLNRLTGKVKPLGEDVQPPPLNPDGSLKSEEDDS